MLKDKLPYLIGLGLSALVGFHIFATSGDLESLRADVATTYVSRAEIEHRLDRIETLIGQIAAHMNRIGDN